MIFAYGIILADFLCRSLALENDGITIGIIANGSGTVETETFSKYDLTFEIVKHFIDATELYEVYRSVKSFDADKNVDTIVLLDYDVAVLKTPHILTTQNKKIIRSGARNLHGQTKRLKKADRFDALSCDTDSEVIPATIYEDTYCKMDLNITQVDRDEVILKMPGPRALRSLIKSLKWSSIIILYDSSTESETSALVDGISKDGVLFALFNTEHVDNMQTLLHEIYHSRINKMADIMIVIVCRLDCITTVLQNANKFDSLSDSKTLLKKFSKWLIIAYDHSKCVSEILKTCANDLDNVALIAVPQYRNTGIEAMTEIIDSSVLNLLRTQVVLNSKADLKEHFINELHKSVQTWSPWNRCQAYYIDTLLWTGNGREFSSVGLADINGNVGLHSAIFPNAKHGYNKRKFRVSTLQYPPFVIKRKVNNTYIYEGFCMDLFNELAKQLNFTYDLTEPADGKWGSYDENFIFNGLVGQLQREEVDIVAAPLSNQAERTPFMDFSYSYYYEYTTVVVKRPDVSARKWRTLIDPFKWEVLVAIGVSLVIVTVITFLLEKNNPFYDVPPHAEDRVNYGGLHTWHSAFWYVFGALLCQGGVHLPDSTSGRTLISCWWLTCIIIVGTYCGNLIAFLTVTKERPPFNTLQELLELKGTYKWGTLGGTSWEMAFPTSSKPTFKAIGEAYQEFSKTDPDILNVNPDFHIQRVKEGQYAWIGDKTFIEISMAKECSLVSIKEEFMPLKYIFGFVNNSPHTAVFTQQMMKIHEGGLLQIWKRKWWPKSNFCAGDTVPEAKPISLMDVQSAFYVCVIGICVGLFAFLIEIVVHKCRTHLQTPMLCTGSADVSREMHVNKSGNIEINTGQTHF